MKASSQQAAEPAGRARPAASGLPHPEAPTNPEQVSRVLRERARRLAQPPAGAPENQEIIEVVFFLAAHERYAAPTRLTREIQPLRDYEAVPGGPHFLLGVVHWRGRIIPVFDLKPLFELPQSGLTELDRVIVLEEERIACGLLANSVEGTRRVPRSFFGPVPPTIGGFRAEFAEGVAPDGRVLLQCSRFVDPCLLDRLKTDR